MTEIEAKPIKPTTLFLIGVISAVLTFFGAMWQCFVPFLARCTLVGLGTILGEPYEMSGMPFTVLSFVMPFVLFSPAIRKRVDGKTLTYIYVIALSASAWSSWVNMSYFVLAKGIGATSAQYHSMIPDFVAVPTDVANSLILGGISTIPWDVWLPVMMFSFLYFGLFALMSIGAANIFRREWIDVETLPFPQTMLAHQTLLQVEGGATAKGKRKGFIFGIAIGFIYTAILSMIIYFPWFPDILAWRTDTCGPGAQYFQATSPWAAWPGLVDMNKHLLGYALCYLLPTSILFSAWFFWVIYEILITIAYYGFGAYSGITTIGTCGRAVWCSSPFNTPPLNLGLLSGGGILGFGLMTFYFQRKDIGSTLMAALGRLSKEEVQAIEKDEPTSYRNSWTMLTTGFILLIALEVGIGLSLAMSFVLVLMGLLNWLWQSRLYGLSGWHIEESGDIKWIPRVFFFPTQPETVTKDYLFLNWQLGSVIGRHPLDGWGCSMFVSFGSYRMASLTGTSSKDTFKVIVVTLFVSFAVFIVTYVWGASTFGFSKSFGWNSYGWANLYESSKGYVASCPSTGPPSEWMGYILAGVLLTIALSVLHARLIWFPHPLGPVLAWSLGSNLFGNWVTFLVAWILKQLTLRYGGSKLYNEVGIPIAGGIAAGYAITTVLFGLGAILYYYVIV